MTTASEAFELGMHSTFKKAGVKTAAQAQRLFKVGEALVQRRRAARGGLEAYELGLRKVAADNGLETREGQDAFVAVARKVAAEKIAAMDNLKSMVGMGAPGPRDNLKTVGKGLSGLSNNLHDTIKAHPTAAAATGTAALAAILASHFQKRRDQNKLARATKVAALGAIIGALREKDPGESRTRAVLRSGATDAAVGAGATAGGVGGGILGGLAGVNLGSRGQPSGKDLAKAESILPAGNTSGAGTAALSKMLKQLRMGKGGAIAGATVGAGLGGAGAYQLAKRVPPKPATGIEKAKGSLQDLKKKLLGK